MIDQARPSPALMPKVALLVATVLTGLSAGCFYTYEASVTASLSRWRWCRWLTGGGPTPTDHALKICDEIPANLFDLTVPDALEIFDSLDDR